MSEDSIAADVVSNSSTGQNVQDSSKLQPKSGCDNDENSSNSEDEGLTEQILQIYLKKF